MGCIQGLGDIAAILPEPNPQTLLFMNPICPYCGKSSVLTDSVHIYGKSLGLIYDCRPCDAYVHVHRNSPTNRPLGTLASSELRVLRVKAHLAFDRIWRRGATTREQAVSWLCAAMGKPRHLAHIHKLNEEECRKLLQLIPNFPSK